MRPLLGAGIVSGTHVWPVGADVPVAVDPLVLDWGGPVGDRHHGVTMKAGSRQRWLHPEGTEIANYRQLSIVGAEELAEVARAMGVPELAPGLIADNLHITGIPALTALPPMTRLIFASGAVVVVGGENDPCAIAGRLVAAVHGTAPAAFPRAAQHKRGLTGWVERPGAISPGEAVEAR